MPANHKSNLRCIGKTGFAKIYDQLQFPRSTPRFVRDVAQIT